MFLQTTAAGGVSWEAVEEKAGSAAPKEKKVKKQMTVKVPKWCSKWVVSMDEFKEGVVGAKSKNLAGNDLFVLRIRPTCPTFCNTPDPASTSKHRMSSQSVCCDSLLTQHLQSTTLYMGQCLHHLMLR